MFELFYLICWVMLKPLDCYLEVSEFELQSRYYVHFRTNTLRKDMKPLITVARGVIVIVVRNEHGDTSSNPGRDWLHFT